MIYFIGGLAIGFVLGVPFIGWQLQHNKKTWFCDKCKWERMFNGK